MPKAGVPLQLFSDYQDRASMPRRLGCGFPFSATLRIASMPKAGVPLQSPTLTQEAKEGIPGQGCAKVTKGTQAGVGNNAV